MTITPSRQLRTPPRDRLVIAATALIGILSAAPGVHLFELFLRPMPAIVMSHGIALALLGTAAYQWRARRRSGVAAPFNAG
ncbi:MAG: hypothetical protein ABI889_11215 [Gemmatimonadota bacterium]